MGALFAKEALARGDNVVATARRLATVEADLGPQPNLLAVALDVNDEAQAHEAVRRAVERFGRIDVVVSNAAFGVLGAVEEISAADVEAVYRTNVFGLLAATRAVLPQLRRQRSGHIFNLSSIGGYRSPAAWGVYTSTKFAVEGISESLADELAPLGIKVTIVEPGYFRTDFLDDASLTTSPSTIPDYTATVGKMRYLVPRIHRNQLGDPARLAKALLKIVVDKDPPLRMPFGSDTVAVIESKNAFVTAELAKWRDLAVSTDFPEGLQSAPP